jgi:hypothetical protein
MGDLFKYFTGACLAVWLASRKSPSVGKMHAHRFRPVYRQLPTGSKRGVFNIGFAKGKSGVYIIKEDGKTVYVGQSQTNLYRTITRHFQDWNDRRSPDRITYRHGLRRHRYTVRVVFVSPARAMKLETMLIKKHRPRDNAAKLNEIDGFYDPTPGEQAVLEEYNGQSYDDIVPF